MKLIDVHIFNARKNLTELINQVRYSGHQVRVHRYDKPMVRIVSEQYMRVIDRIIAENPGLADTIAAMLNEDDTSAIEDSQTDFRAGRVRPLERKVA